MSYRVLSPSLGDQEFLMQLPSPMWGGGIGGGSKLKRTRPRSVCWCSQFGLTGAGAGLSGLKLGHLSLPLPSLSSTVSE